MKPTRLTAIAIATFIVLGALAARVSDTSSPAALAADPLTVVRGAAAAGAVASRVNPPKPPGTTTPAPTAGHFVTLPPGSALPSDAACAAAVRPMPERRPDNAVANHTVGTNSQVPGVTGNFVGTTDELIEWVACKWGIDEDVVRAQIALESGWHQNHQGDFSTDASTCHPDFRTVIPCPQSIGLGQIRFPYHGAAYADKNAIKSSAYNLDYTYFRWRSCFDGNEGWLNGFERGQNYVAGDVWGCVGLWFAGRWHTSDANGYILRVQDYLNRRIWDTPAFANF